LETPRKVASFWLREALDSASKQDQYCTCYPCGQERKRAAQAGDFVLHGDNLLTDAGEAELKGTTSGYLR